MLNFLNIHNMDKMIKKKYKNKEVRLQELLW